MENHHQPEMGEMKDLFERFTAINQQTIQQFLQGIAGSGAAAGPIDPAGLMQQWLDNSTQLSERQGEHYKRQMDIWLGMLAGQANPADGTPAASTAAHADRRFASAEWAQYPFFDYLRQSYAAHAEWLGEAVEEASMDEDARRKLRYVARQYLDALAPSNFLWTNPEVLRLAVETKGESLAEGLKRLKEDLAKGYISQTDESQFEVGKNLAITPGQVVFRNHLFELIQYTPQTPQVRRRPLLIVPPCVNRYYLMDLQPNNSFVNWTVQQGFTVFLVSWRSITKELGHTTWEDYLTHGVFPAVDVAHEIGGADKINLLGFCIGGTISTTALAVLRARGDKRVASFTLLTSMIDHSDTGEIQIFVNDELLKRREEMAAQGGLVRGKEIAVTFSSLRANDLIWSYVINNYLKGQMPPPFDLLYWNNDGSNLALPMHVYFLRHMYLENNLIKPGKLTLCGVPVDVSRINLPTYLVGAREDHIVPWKTAYQSVNHLKGPRRFVLAASGHIAGSMNPAQKNKRNYWVNPELPADPDAWLAAAESRPGSWWWDWAAWLAARSGRMVAAPTQHGTARFPPLEPAPGIYVRTPPE